MAFISIISIPGSNQVATMQYFFKDGSGENNKRFIVPGEVVEVPDAELQKHLDSGKVMQVPGPDAAPKRGRPAKQTVDEEFGKVFAAQR